MKGKTAIVIGGSGLVGSELIKELLLDPYYDEVKLFVRKKVDVGHKKIVQHILDFENIQASEAIITGDVVFCCIGTTINVAGSKEAFTKVDKTYPLVFAESARKNGIGKFLLVSSLGADMKSSNFYLKVKGEVELGLENLRFDHLVIVRPSMLLGKRIEFRLGELIGKCLMKSLGFLFIGKFKKYKAIEATTVAKAMLQLSKQELDKVKIFESNRLQQLGK